jgi:hypothetical protein
MPKPCFDGLFSALQHFPYGLGQLVGTRSAFEAATDAFQFRDNVFSFHAFHEGGDALRIAVAAAVELHILQNAVLDFKLNGLTASALGSVSVSHWISVFNYEFYE